MGNIFAFVPCTSKLLMLFYTADLLSPFGVSFVRPKHSVLFSKRHDDYYNNVFAIIICIGTNIFRNRTRRKDCVSKCFFLSSVAHIVGPLAPCKVRPTIRLKEHLHCRIREVEPHPWEQMILVELLFHIVETRFHIVEKCNQ